MIWSLIGSIEGKALDIVDNVVEDKDKTNRLKFEIQRLGHTITAVLDPNAITAVMVEALCEPFAKFIHPLDRNRYDIHLVGELETQLRYKWNKGKFGRCPSII